MTPDGPLLWFLNRGSGFALLAVLTLAVLLGVVSRSGRAGAVIPAFVLQSLHRSTSLLGVVFLVVHVVTAVVDEFVDLRWWDAIIPFGAAYEPLWLGVGALSLDLIAVLVLTSLLRERLGLTTWRAVHFSAYAAWGLGTAHGLGIGTDSGERWAAAAYFASAVVVSAALLLRLAEAAGLASPRRAEVRR